jgi:hypothetical protein
MATSNFVAEAEFGMPAVVRRIVGTLLVEGLVETELVD